jgi:hypothetical protein
VRLLFSVVQAVHLLVRKAGNQSLCLAICRLQVRQCNPAPVDRLPAAAPPGAQTAPAPRPRSPLAHAAAREIATLSAEHLRFARRSPHAHLDTHTAPWGVKVANVEVKQVDMPGSMLRAMAKQAEAKREKRSKIIHAEGEFSAAQRLVDAAHLLATEPVSIQLRYLQTLTEIGVDKNTTIVFPLPLNTAGSTLPKAAASP